MSNLVIVAIPEQDDPVWFYSSEKVPHLTLLFLGESNKVENQDNMIAFLEHAANTTLNKFYLDVDHRGILGPDEADVLFFSKTGWDDCKALNDFRGQILQDDNIKKAYLAVQQYPEWQPHLTLGYPTKPAKPFKDPFQKFYSVCFDKIAFWSGDFEGPEFQLQRINYDMGMSMDSVVDDILSHHGVKGMRWGRRKALSAPTDVSVTTIPKRNKQKVVTKGGERHPAHSDAVIAKVSAQKAKKSGLHSLSNDELQSLAKRLNLEKQVSELAKDQLASNGEKVVSALMELQGV